MDLSQTTEKQFLSRAKILEGLGTERKTLRWTEELGIVWLFGYYLIQLYLAPIFISGLPFSSNLRLVIWLLIPVPGATLAWWIIRSKSIGKSIVFDAKGFQFHDDNRVTFEQSWARLKTSEITRKGLLVTRLDGSSEIVSIPTVKISRDSTLFFKILKGYSSGKDKPELKKRWFVAFITMFVAGIAGAVGFGRPTMLKPGFEGEIGIRQYGEVGIWAISFLLIIIGLYGFMIASAVAAERKQKQKEREVKSRFGPNIRQLLDEQDNWPKPINLEPGKKFRYIDPDGVMKTLKDQVSGLYALPIMFMILPAFFVIVTLVKGQPKHFDWTPWISCGIFAVGGCISIPFIPRFKRRQLFVEDEISVDSESLIVSRNGQIFRYPRKPEQVMRDDYPKKESRRPFGRVEKYGSKPDIYELDRRYLMETPTLEQQQD